MKRIMVLPAIAPLCAMAQSVKSNYIVVEGGDTIFCKAVSYRTTPQGYLGQVVYTDLDGKTWEMEGKNNLKSISSFYNGGGFTDKIPQRVSKPDSYVRWAPRVVDGKLKVNYYESMMSSGINSTFKKFYVRMPDGTFYDVDTTDRKKHIIPYLQQCEAFNAAYKGNFSNEFNSFVKMIQLYNEVCR